MLYALICTDRPDHFEMRKEVRPTHVAYLESLGDTLIGAGPFLNGEEMPNGSLVIIDAPDLAAAKAIADADPYAQADLFESTDIRPWLWKIKNPTDQT